MWCDDTRLKEELIECHIGSFVQVHIETLFSDLVRIDLQAALQRSIDTLHLPVKRPQDNQVMMKVFVPHGVTCFSGTTFVCISQFENWQAVLIAAGKRAYPGRNPDTMIFHRVHSAIEEVSSLHDPILYYSSVEILVGVAKVTGQYSLIYGHFNSLGLWLVHHVSDLCPIGPKEPVAISLALAACLCPQRMLQMLARYDLHPCLTHRCSLSLMSSTVMYRLRQLSSNSWVASCFRASRRLLMMRGGILSMALLTCFRAT